MINHDFMTFDLARAALTSGADRATRKGMPEGTFIYAVLGEMPPDTAILHIRTQEPETDALYSPSDADLNSVDWYCY